jgi:hypothetical protein
LQSLRRASRTGPGPGGATPRRDPHYTVRMPCSAGQGRPPDPPEPVWHTPGPHVSDASPKPEPSSTKLRWSTGSLSVSGHMPGPGRPCLRGHIHISCWQLHGPGAVTHHVPARLIRGGHDVRKPRKRNRDSRSWLSLMRSPRLVSRRLGLEQHYREAAPTIAAIWLNSKMPRQQNLFSQLLNIFAAYLVAIAPDNARPPRTPPSTNDLSSGQSGCQAHCLCVAYQWHNAEMNALTGWVTGRNLAGRLRSQPGPAGWLPRLPPRLGSARAPRNCLLCLLSACGLVPGASDQLSR